MLGCVWSPGILLPGTFMYSCTVFMPRMVWPTWLSRFPAETTRAKAGSLLSSCSCCFHLVERAGTARHEPLRDQLPAAAAGGHTHFLSSDTSMLVPNLMCFNGPRLLRTMLKKKTTQQIVISHKVSLTVSQSKRYKIFRRHSTLFSERLASASASSSSSSVFYNVLNGKLLVKKKKKANGGRNSHWCI